MDRRCTEELTFRRDTAPQAPGGSDRSWVADQITDGYRSAPRLTQLQAIGAILSPWIARCVVELRALGYIVALRLLAATLADSGLPWRLHNLIV